MSNIAGIGTIRLMGPDFNSTPEKPIDVDAENQEAHNIFWDHMGLVEQLLNNKLPEGYYVKVDQA